MTENLAETFDQSAKSFTVVVPQGNGYSNPLMMCRVSDHFQQLNLNAEFVSKEGIPVQDAHGAYTLVTKDARAEMLAPRLLSSHYGLLPIPN
ncbi:MAG TPA: hypothetical protein VL625_03435 [Patescibacteria group bacterium]|jgi:hypothetical protein|nr:hypothetical protein [Patescibacteria group bacterium]